MTLSKHALIPAALAALALVTGCEAADDKPTAAADAPVAEAPAETPAPPVDPAIAAAEKAAAEKAAADKAAEDKAAADKAAAAAAAEAKAAADKAAAEKAALGTVSQQNATAKAADYLDYSSFSRSGLIEQLEYEGFTPTQAEHGVNQTGL